MVLLTASLPARATPDEPIVLAGGDEAFRAALAEALVPAGMTVVPVADPPAPTVGDVAAQSRQLAEHDRATATIWLIEENGVATLVTYDRDVDRVLVRALPYTLPLTVTQAAEAARMARTMLRALRVTPDLDLAPPRVAEAIAVRQRAAVAELPVLPHATPVPAAFALEVGGGVRFGGPAAAAGAIGSAAFVWRPEQWGAAVTGMLASSGDVATSTFTGTIRDDSIALTARLPLPLGERLAAAAELGAAIHLVSLGGDLASGGAATSFRIDPALRVRASCNYELGSFGVGIGVTVDWLARRQAYEVDTTEVLRIRMFQISAGLGLTARFL